MKKTNRISTEVKDDDENKEKREEKCNDNDEAK